MEIKSKNSSILNNKNNNLIINKSNKNLLNKTSIINGINTELKDEKNNNLNIENINNNIKTVEENATNLEESKNLENIKSLKSEKTKNTSCEEYSSSTRRKNILYHEKYRILTHKASVYDSLNDEELEDEEDINSLYLEPNSFFTIIFDSILFIFTLISLIEIPFYLAMNKKFCRNKTITINFLFNFCIDLLNIFDLFLGFFRAYYDLEEHLIKKNKKIALNYLCGWFLFDLIASVPIYTINIFFEHECIENEIVSKYSNTILDNLHYILISNRLLKVFKVFLFNQGWENISQKLNDYGSIILYISLVYAAINYTACFYIFVGRNSFPNWIFKTQLDTESFLNIYISAIYILTMAVTTVGYGDITCYSMNEIIFQLFILIIGIIGYSYVVSFVSNYIAKINEKSVDFEKRKEILDEIRISHPNLPDELYDRIIRYLKFKNFEQKKIVNTIFVCLPVGLKNNLITEMYKPIIQNFIFFKNFENTDFIVKVVLAFKTILAFKNDILVNEGDIVEDIIFVKKGVLIVELPINMANPQENIDKFLKEPMLAIEKGPNVEKLGNSTIIQGGRPSFNNILYNSTIQEQDLKTKNTLNYNSPISSFFTMKYAPTIKASLTKIEKERKEKEEKELERKKHLTYVKILGIRQNEHFGDVLMFLEERSPLRVRVRSIKCELFFLKKIDAVNISANYPNIWKRINKKSVFNFEQMKKSIKNIVEVYCAKKIKSNNKEKCKIDLKENHINFKKKESNSNVTVLKTIKEEEYIKNSQSQKNIKINYIKLFKNNEIHDDDFILENKNKSAIFERKKNFILPSSNNDILLSSSNSSVSSILSPIKKNNNKIKNNSNNKNNIIEESLSDSEVNFSSKVKDVFNRNYNKIEILNNNENKKGNNSIIIEETEKEESDNKFSSIIRKSNIPAIENKVYYSRIMNNNLSNINIRNDQKEDNSESENSYNKVISNELNTDEVINFINEENLLNKKIDLDLVSSNKSTHNNLEFKNSKLNLLLKILDNKNDIPQKDKYIKANGNIINENSEKNNNSSVNNENKIDNGTKNLVSNDSNENCAVPQNKINKNIIRPVLSKKSNVLSINNNISFKIDSSYENFNEISGKILIKNRILQNKLKNYLLDEIKYIPTIESNITNKKIYSEGIKTMEDPKNIEEKSNKFMSPQKLDKRKSSPFDFRKFQLFKKRDSNLYNSKSIEKNSKKINFSSFVNESISTKNKKDKNLKINKLQNGFGHEIENSLSNNKVGKKRRLSQPEILNYNINNLEIDSPKKNKPKKISSIKKKRDNNLLSQINLNIQKTNQNLNNPEEFYSSYFNSLLERKKNEKTTKRNSVFLPEKVNISNILEEKVNRNNLFKINES